MVPASLLLWVSSAHALNFAIGVTYGGIAAYFGGKVDEIMMRIVDILYGIPTLIIVILLTVLSKTRG